MSQELFDLQPLSKPRGPTDQFFAVFPVIYFTLFALRLENQKEAKRNLPRWVGSTAQVQTAHNALLHLVQYLCVTRVPGSCILFASFHSLSFTAFVCNNISSLDSNSD